MLLTALGVEPDTVEQDYLQSSLRMKVYTEELVTKINEIGRNGEIIRPMMDVRSEYLDAALDEIDLLFGGMDNYLQKVLKVNAGLLRAKFLE